jgi:hypothetical protein
MSLQSFVLRSALMLRLYGCVDPGASLSHHSVSTACALLCIHTQAKAAADAQSNAQLAAFLRAPCRAYASSRSPLGSNATSSTAITGSAGLAEAHELEALANMSGAERCADQSAAAQAQHQLQMLYWQQHEHAQAMQSGALAALQQKQQHQFQVRLDWTIASRHVTNQQVLVSCALRHNLARVVVNELITVSSDAARDSVVSGHQAVL